MSTTQQKGLSSSRVLGPPSANVDLLECSICQDLLWKPVACQTCETPFCSACINQWLTNNPNRCPNQCKSYIERKCPPSIVKLLSQLQISCSYQEQGCKEVIAYEALDKHEIECGYQPQQCPGCKSKILKMDFVKHENECTLIELTCQDCKLVYNRVDADTKHTENICLKEQLRQLRDESNKNKLEVQELSRQLSEIRSLNPMSTKVTLTFADLPMANEKSLAIPNIYKGLKWRTIAYMHKSFAKNNYPKSGYAAAFISAGSSHIAFFKDQGSIGVERPNETFTFFSFHACASWRDNLQLTIKGYQNSTETSTHTVILVYGKPQLILLQWKNIDKVVFESSGGTPHLGSPETAGAQVILTQLVIGQLE